MLCRKVESDIDVRPFLSEIEYVSSVAYDQLGITAWDMNTYRQDTIKFHKHTQNIILRVQDVTTESQPNTLEVKNGPTYPDLWMCTKNWLDEFEVRHNCEVMAALYIKLFANEEVGAHIDEGRYYRTYDRYHFVLTGSYALCLEPSEDETEVFMCEAGNLYWFDNQVRHGVINGEEDRIALIFDTKRNES